MPGPILWRQDIPHIRAGKGREIGKGRIRKKQVFGILQNRVILGQAKIISRNARQDPGGFLYIIGNDHKFHFRIYFFHIPDAVLPVFFP